MHPTFSSSLCTTVRQLHEYLEKELSSILKARRRTKKVKKELCGFFICEIAVALSFVRVVLRVLASLIFAEGFSFSRRRCLVFPVFPLLFFFLLTIPDGRPGSRCLRDKTDHEYLDENHSSPLVSRRATQLIMIGSASFHLRIDSELESGWKGTLTHPLYVTQFRKTAMTKHDDNPFAP